MTQLTRRQALGATSVLIAGGCATVEAVDAPAEVSRAAGLALPPVSAAPEAAARDDGFWRAVADLYDVTDEVVHLEHGNWGMMARPVLDAHMRHLEAVNRRNSYYARREFGADGQRIRAQLAEALGVEPDEVALTRGATEALQNLIGGYNRLRPGDTVLYADLDYGAMQTAMDWLAERRGVTVVAIDLPEPATRQSLIDAYAAALEANPRTRLLLATHLSHRTGLVLPIADICDLARAHDADVIVDAAHSWGQLDFAVPELKADFVGVNLHKWIGAPLGVGAMVVRKDRIADIDPYMAEPEREPGDILARVHTGTFNYAAFLAVPDALDIHAAIGPARKEARLRHLRTLWAEELRDHPAIDILTPADPALHAGITSFRLTGTTSPRDNIALAAQLLDEHGVFTVHRTGAAKGACVRVTPGVFTSEEDVARFTAALREIADTHVG